MRTPNTFQIGSTTYTTREYCNARGITDNARILKIQWRINTYIRNHTIQQTIEELDRLTLRQEGIRPWQGTQKERTRAIDQRELLKRSEPSDKIERYVATKLGKELYATERKLLQQSEWMNNTPYVTINNNPISLTKESLSNEETQKPTTDTTGLLITITDHLELLVGKTIKHEKFPLEGKIVGISYDIIEIDFNGKIVELELQETKGLLIVS